MISVIILLARLRGEMNFLWSALVPVVASGETRKWWNGISVDETPVLELVDRDCTS